MLEFRILGPLEVVSDGSPVPLGGPKQRATLAILLLRANRVVSIDRLADDLYAGAPPVTAVTQVQRQISELRKALGTESAIETRAPGYLTKWRPAASISPALSRGRAMPAGLSRAAMRERPPISCAPRCHSGAAHRSPISRTSPSRR